jgi:putative addiction module killer protein
MSGKMGRAPYRTWFDGLHPQAAAKVATATAPLELGNTSSVKWIGAIGEYRIDWGPGYRIYLAQDRTDLIILLGVGTKRRQAEIARVKALFEEYKARKAAVARPRGKR